MPPLGLPGQPAPAQKPEYEQGFGDGHDRREDHAVQEFGDSGAQQAPATAIAAAPARIDERIDQPRDLGCKNHRDHACEQPQAERRWRRAPGILCDGFAG